MILKVAFLSIKIHLKRFPVFVSANSYCLHITSKEQLKVMTTLIESHVELCVLSFLLMDQSLEGKNNL